MAVLSSVNLEAQRSHFVQIAPGISSSGMRDFGFSPLLYHGVGMYASISYKSFDESLSDVVEAGFSQSTRYNRFETEMKATQVYLNAFRFFHKSKEANKGLHWGYANRNAYNLRNNDAISNFNNRFHYYTAFGPAVRYKRPFELFNRSFTFETIADIQLLGFMLQSAFVSSSPKGYETNASGTWEIFIESVELFYPGAAWNMAIAPAIVYPFKSGNGLVLRYQYEFLWLKSAHVTQKSSGIWSLGLNVVL